MIILGFSASNILKYRELEAREIPATGLIGISGPNEAGKSTIAEALCLGLYGRTFSCDSEHFIKAIRWGAASGEIRVDFAVDHDTAWSVTRYFDNDGNHSALLTPRGNDEPLAQGADEVTARITELTGCSFQQYVDSFYLAQREFDIPHAQSDMIKGLLGIRDLDAVAGSLGEELADDQARLADIDQTIAAHQQRIGELEAASEDLQALEHRQQTAQDEAREQDQQHEALGESATAIEDRIEHLRTSVSSNLDLIEDSEVSRLDEDCQALNTDLQDLQLLCEQQACTEVADTSPLSLWAEEQQQRLAPLKALIERGKANARQWQIWLGDIDPHVDGEADDDLSDNEVESDATDTQAKADNSNGSSTAKAQAEEEGYPEQRDRLQGQIASLPRKRRSRRLFAFITLLLGGAGGWAWWLLNKAPEAAQSKQLQSWLGETLPQFQPLANAEHMQLLQYGSGALLAIGVIFTLLSMSLTGRLARARGSLALLNQQADLAREEIRSMDGIEAAAVTEALIRLESLSDEALVADTLAYTNDGAEQLVQAHEWGQHLADLKRAAPTLDLIQRTLSAQLDDALAASRAQTQRHQQALQTIAEAISAEQQRREEIGQLGEEIRALTDQQDDPTDRIAVRNAGLELIKGTVRSIYTAFNQQMREYLGRLLPLFTEGRYQHLKIDDDFSVQVFSTEKNDFAELDDLSSGTQRQLILAIRLAMSQAMVDSHQQSHQSLILDEPFAFFDRERMRQTLATLQSFSQEISQVWVISQEFDSDAPFDVIIPCQRDQHSIHIEAGDSASARPHPSKYSPLAQYLGKQALNPDPVSLSFAEIEDIIHAALPQSAYKNRDWWSNHNDPAHRPQARAWMEAGFQVGKLEQHKDSGAVVFVRG